MNKLTKLALGAVVAGGVAMAAAAPANAGVSIGIGIGGGPGPNNWCYHHPYRCGAYRGGPYADGYFLAGRGYFWHGGWYGHRGWDHGRWRYWR